MDAIIGFFVGARFGFIGSLVDAFLGVVKFSTS